MLHTIFWLRLLGVMGVNLMLSGDNAVVVAMAARQLPDRQRRRAIVFGTGAIVVLLIAFTLAISFLLKVPLLRVIGALALVVIAWKLATESSHDDAGGVQAGTTLSQAIRVIVIADMIMSLDNVIALVGVSDGNYLDLTIGLVITMPVVIFGATLLTRALERWPWLVFAGAGLLVYVAVEMFFQDRVFDDSIGLAGTTEHLIGIGAGAIFVALAWTWTHRRERGDRAEPRRGPDPTRGEPVYHE